MCDAYCAAACSIRLSNLTYLVIIINRRRYIRRAAFATHIDYRHHYCYYDENVLISCSFYLILIYVWWQLEQVGICVCVESHRS